MTTQAITAAEALLRRFRELSELATTELAASNAEALEAALDERERLLGELQVVLRPLAAAGVPARGGGANGTAAGFAALEPLARAAQEANEALVHGAAECLANLAVELRRLERADTATDAYAHSAQQPGSTLDQVR